MIEGSDSMESGLSSTLLNALPEGVLVTTPEGKIVALNQAMVQLMGLSKAKDAIGRVVQDFYAHPERERKLILDALSRVGS